ncbi:KipI family sensor histidine kinase inhibitor [Jatrophihabitans sp. GAS493]|uniref:5-oxoprolinase subunit B family protein n=1 Tax=Jatrophihabitans sp. GAS493 TaxID=1907575 RepID=UPI000BB6F2D6|nr:allophanate hydrolase subunit 1 [Jatrophihabitans sp. GAS493]SOD72673.1 KipI family sensor histidine kinase inhibitor [Jatrophihabitans sp. GAS493]
MTLRLLRYGDRALLIEVTNPEAVLPLAEFVGRLPGVIEVVPAARSVLLRLAADVAGEAGTPAAVRAALGDFDETTPPPAARGRSHRIAVRYDGADLQSIGRQTALSPAEVVKRHSGAVYRVAFCGFAPGFAYLSGLPRQLQLPRLATPRTSVPAGSVAIAAEYSAVYPRSSPGGWLLLGSTTETLWDLAANSPALLSPGDTVRFEAI